MMVHHVYFNAYNISLRVYIRRVYNISPLGLILFPWVHNPLGFLIQIGSINDYQRTLTVLE